MKDTAYFRTTSERPLVMYPSLSGPPACVPMFERPEDAAAYCVDLICAHVDDDPAEQTQLLTLIADRLLAHQHDRAAQLRSQADGLYECAAAYENATKTCS